MRGHTRTELQLCRVREIPPAQKRLFECFAWSDGYQALYIAGIELSLPPGDSIFKGVCWESLK